MGRGVVHVGLFHEADTALFGVVPQMGESWAAERLIRRNDIKIAFDWRHSLSFFQLVFLRKYPAHRFLPPIP